MGAGGRERISDGMSSRKFANEDTAKYGVLIFLEREFEEQIDDDRTVCAEPRGLRCVILSFHTSMPF